MPVPDGLSEEPLLQELRQRQLTAVGRAKLCERVAVEHTLVRVGQWQGDRDRYIGVRKNLFDLRRIAVVHNLHVIPNSLLQPLLSMKGIFLSQLPQPQEAPPAFIKRGA